MKEFGGWKSLRVLFFLIRATRKKSDLRLPFILEIYFLALTEFCEILLILLFSIHDRYFVCRMAVESLVAQLRIRKQNLSTFALSKCEMELKMVKECGAWEAWHSE